MKLKLDANGNAVLQDGKPIYVHDDGKEIAFDAPATVATISRINAEAKSHRERADAAETKLKPYEGITDPTAAMKALETVANLDGKKLVDAGEVQKVKDEAIKAVRAEYEPIVKKAADLESALYGEKIGGSFARSKVIADKFAIPADMVQARFGQNFKIEDGKTVAYDATGSKIFSRTRPGEVADFEEALEVLVDGYAYKAQILKGTGASGGGASGSGQGGGGGQKTVTRTQFASMSASEQASTGAAAAKGEIVIAD